MLNLFDFINRFSNFISQWGSVGIFSFLAVSGLIMILIFVRKIYPLIFFLWVSLMLSGSFNLKIDSLFTLIRWLLIIFISIGVLFSGIKKLPTPSMLLILYAFVGVISIPLSPNPIWAIQFSIMLIITAGGLGSAFYKEVSTENGIYKLLSIIESGALFYIGLSIIGLLGFRGGMRYSGVWTSAPLFVIIGGVMLPILLWLASDPMLPLTRRVKDGVLFGIIAVLCVFSGERTGTLAGLVGSLIVILRLKKRQNIAVFVSIILILFGILSYTSRYNRQWEFVRYRYFEHGLSGRPERWQKALQLCINEPLVPHGIGASNFLGFGFHNAYLVTWYEGGLLGLVLFLSAIVLTLLRGLKAIFSREDEIRRVGTLVVSVMIALILTGFAESKFISPSNIEIVLFIFIGAMSELLNNPVEIVRKSLNYENSRKSWIKRFLLRAVYH